MQHLVFGLGIHAEGTRVFELGKLVHFRAQLLEGLKIVCIAEIFFQLCVFIVVAVYHDGFDVVNAREDVQKVFAKLRKNRRKFFVEVVVELISLHKACRRFPGKQPEVSGCL